MPNEPQGRALELAEADLESPPHVAGLEMTRLLAKGGFAQVWEARQISLDRRVAVKFLRPEHLGQEQMEHLFAQEASVLARLNHPNVVQIIDRGRTEVGPYFVMEFVDGDTLQMLIAKGRLHQGRALRILTLATKGLAYAHNNRVVHRDVKPANILISRTGQVKISDFGIAAVKARTGSGDTDTAANSSPALGTRAYMAPEQRVSFDGVGPEADVYSMGVILHRVLTGRLPPAPGKVADDVDMPPGVRPIVERALTLEPKGRYKDAAELHDALVSALQGTHLDDRVREGAQTTIGSSGSGKLKLLDVIRQDDRRSVYLVGKEGGERIVVKRYVKDTEALRVVRELGRLQHPNIVRIHAVGERHDAFVMIMEYLSGGDLRERLVRPHPWSETARVALQVAKALAHASRCGIVHGNLRPSNILFDAQGSVRVSDFGLPEHYRGEGDKRNWYAAPEGGPRSASADLYALGAIMFEMLTASPMPASTEDPFAMLLLRREIPPAFLEILHRLLAPPGIRYVSASEVADDLEKLFGQGWERPRAPAASPRVAAPAADAPAAMRAPLVAPAAHEAPRSVSPLPARLVESRPGEHPANEGPRPGYGPALLGLGGLLFVWILQLPAVQRLLIDLFAR